jgi:ABC-type nitrate/sulfonate/bicarbonate transport system ATPase subunit
MNGTDRRAERLEMLNNEGGSNMHNPFLELSRVTIDFPTPEGSFRALEDVNLKIDEGEFVSLIGHSGCGKSTVLNIVAGLLRATSGGVILNGKEVVEPGPDRAVVFQQHSLFPWLTVYQNVELAVKHVLRDERIAVRSVNGSSTISNWSTCPMRRTRSRRRSPAA